MPFLVLLGIVGSASNLILMSSADFTGSTFYYLRALSWSDLLYLVCVLGNLIVNIRNLHNRERELFIARLSLRNHLSKQRWWYLFDIWNNLLFDSYGYCNWEHLHHNFWVHYTFAHNWQVVCIFIKKIDNDNDSYFTGIVQFANQPF